MHFYFMAFPTSNFYTIFRIYRTISFCPILPLFSSYKALFSMLITTYSIFFFSPSAGSGLCTFFFGRGLPKPLSSTTLWTYFSSNFRCLLIIYASLGRFWNIYSSIISIILLFYTGVISILFFPPDSFSPKILFQLSPFPKLFPFLPSYSSSSSADSTFWDLRSLFMPGETSLLLSSPLLLLFSPVIFVFLLVFSLECSDSLFFYLFCPIDYFLKGTKSSRVKYTRIDLKFAFRRLMVKSLGSFDGSWTGLLPFFMFFWETSSFYSTYYKSSSYAYYLNSLVIGPIFWADFSGLQWRVGDLGLGFLDDWEISDLLRLVCLKASGFT